MIIFDLDGTLANCEHRRHFVDATKSEDLCFEFDHIDSHGVPLLGTEHKGRWFSEKDLVNPWKPDWKSFYEACNEDNIIWPVVRVIESLGLNDVTLKEKEIQIWSGRCESLRDRTVHWLKYIIGNSTYSHLKMRPHGNNRPDYELKEHWYNIHNMENPNEHIEFVFDSDPKSIAMWRRRGIFVFDVNQTRGEF